MSAILSYEFMQNAILVGIMASIVCGVIGPFIVTRRMVFISGGLSHTAFGGLGIAYWLGIRPLFGAMAFVLAAAVLIGRQEEKGSAGTICSSASSGPSAWQSASSSST